MSDVNLKPVIRNTVQELPDAKNGAGAATFDLWAVSAGRSPLLPAWGTRARERALRAWDREDYQLLWSGAVAGLLNQWISTEWEIKSDNDDGGTDDIGEAYHELIANAHFGAGYGAFISMTGRDYLRHDIGAFIEIIGAGDPMKPLTGQVIGIAHLDSLRCIPTGDPEYPVIYYATDGKMHRMHRTRVYQLVDMPDGDESYPGVGRCALSRAITVLEREVLMNKYIRVSLDDEPKPGIALASGMNEETRNKAFANYLKEQQRDAKQPWGRTAWLYSLDAKSNPVNVEFKAFAEPPEHFSFREYTELNVNALALALGVDKLDLWELTSAALGSGQQSQIMASKSKGRTYGAFLTALERFFNELLPDTAEFAYNTRDIHDDMETARAAQMYTNVAKVASGMLSIDEQRRYLANQVEGISNAITDTEGNVQRYDDTRDQAKPEDMTNAPEQQAQPGQQPPPQQGAQQQKGYPEYDPNQKRGESGQWVSDGGEMVQPFTETQKAELYRKEHEQRNYILYRDGEIKISDNRGNWIKPTDAEMEKARQLLSADERLAAMRRSSPRPLMRSQTIEGKTYAVAPGTSEHTPYKLIDERGNEVTVGRITTDTNGYVLSRYTKTGRYQSLGRYSIEDGKLVLIPYRLRELTNTKDYDDTRSEFVSRFVALVRAGAADEVTRRRFGFVLRGHLQQLGRQAFRDGLAAGGVQDEMSEEDRAKVALWLKEQSAFVTKFANELYSKGLPESMVVVRAQIWANKSLETMYQAGIASADANGMYMWQLGNTEEHCKTCLACAGQVHRMKTWQRTGLMPKAGTLECGGWQCDCSLARTDSRARGRLSRVPKAAEKEHHVHHQPRDGHGRFVRKGGFDPNQPRDDQGQWTDTYALAQRRAEIPEGVRTFQGEPKDLAAKDKEWADSLSEAERTAINSYQNSARAYNDYLRGDIETIKRNGLDPEVIGERTKLIIDAIERAPSYEGTVWRGIDMQGMTQNAIETYWKNRIGTAMQWDGLSSSSLDPGVGAVFSGSNTGVVFEINGKTGKYIDVISHRRASSPEYEVIFRPGSQFRVIAVRPITIRWENLDVQRLGVFLEEIEQ